jgi:hypothetical protein
MQAFIMVVTLVFVLGQRAVGMDQDLLPSMDKCDEVALALILKDLEKYPDAKDFGWWCQQVPLKGHPPSDLLKDHPVEPMPAPHIPGDKEA